MKKSKKYFVLFFVLTLVLSWGAPVYSITEGLSGQIVILHTNDGHGRAAEGTFGITLDRVLSAKTWNRRERQS